MLVPGLAVAGDVVSYGLGEFGLGFWLMLCWLLALVIAISQLGRRGMWLLLTVPFGLAPGAIVVLLEAFFPLGWNG